MQAGESRRKRCKRWDRAWDAHCLTFSCFSRRPFLSGVRAPLWFLEAADQARQVCPFALWGYVIMPEHVHLVLLPGETVTVSSILWHIKRPVTFRALAWVRKNRPAFLAQMTDRQPNGTVAYRFWQRGGGYDRNLRSVRDVHEKIQYIHENPVRRGLVNRPEDWPWSSYLAWRDGSDERIRIDRESLPPLET